MRRVVCMMAAGLFLGAAGAARANNLQITNVTVSGRDDSTAYVQFDIKWENSWRYSNTSDALYFHDAAWVFFKVLPDGSADWKHVTLQGTGTNPTDYVVGSGTPIEMVVPPDRVGMIVRRSGDGTGTTSVQNVKAVWNFASNSLSKTDKVKIQAFGVEMVYVAQGNFEVGDGLADASQFTKTTITTSVANVTGGYPTGQTPPTNIWPNGWNAFYCMKDEVTEGQWVDFFNTLTAAQKTTRDITGNVNGGKNSDYPTASYRNAVAWTSGDATTARRDRACNYLSWADLMAFTDWAGLRPMTELEFEKACRGPLTPVAGEYAWGSVTIMADASRSISGTENGTETITSATSSGGCNYGAKAHTGSGDGDLGPLRAGIFATNGASRATAGASYWGIMELSGNVLERPVTIGTVTGRAFTGAHGDGKLTTSGTHGDADVSNWPAPSTALGAGLRGGNWSYGATLARVSDRTYATLDFTTRFNHTGGRAVRSAP